MQHLVISVNLSGIPAVQKLAFANHVKLCLTGNIHFPNPFPALSDLQTAIDEFETAITRAIHGGKKHIAVKHDKEYRLMRMLKLLAAYAEYMSDDNESVALSSGFSIKQQVPHTSSGFAAKNTAHSGEVLLKTKALKRTFYTWQYTSDLTGATGWETIETTKRAQCKVKGLEPMKKYLFRLALLNKTGQQPFSEAVELLVL